MNFANILFLFRGAHTALACLALFITSSAFGDHPLQSGELFAPTLKEFGYESVGAVLDHLSQLPLLDMSVVEGKLSWFRLPVAENFATQEYFLAENSKHEVFFVIARQAHGIVQFFGPLDRQLN